MYASVVVNRPTHRRPPEGGDPVRGGDAGPSTYTYRLPDDLAEEAAVGHLIRVPLQASAALGVIVGLDDEPPADLSAELLRDVETILDPLPVVTPIQIELARWMADHLCEPLNQTMRLMLPPGLEARTFVVVDPTARSVPDGLSPEEGEVLRLIRRYPRTRLSVLLNKLSAQDPEAVLDALADRGLLTIDHAFVPPQPAPPRVQYVRLLADDATITASLPRLGRASKQADILQILARRADAPMTLAELCERADCTTSPVRALEHRGWVQVTERRTVVTVSPGTTSDTLEGLARAPKQAEVLSVLLMARRPMEIGELLALANASASTVAELERKGWARRFSEPPLVLLALPNARVLDATVELRGAERERAVLDALQGSTDRVWVGGLYADTGADLTTLQKLAARGLVSLHADEYGRPAPPGQGGPPMLTREQAAVWREIQRGIVGQRVEPNPFVVLLHGVTGSGKTEIYLRAVETTLQQGRRAIILVPEISLTPQAVRRFEARFPGRVAITHSQLSQGQRYAVWDRVRRGEADVLIGARSALLAPMPRLGLVVLDEAHDDSYKQTEPIPLPAYDARACAVELARLCGASVISGSATPDLVTYYRARHGSARLLSLSQRILPLPASAAGEPQRGQAEAQPLPPVRVVDLRQELRAGNRGIFSRALQIALFHTLDAGQQAILFLNRRGTATFVVCRDCGHVALCPRCEVPLTYHTHMRTTLLCHRCSYRAQPPETCPECGGHRIRYFGLGTERVEAAVRDLIPGARLLRWDHDTATGFDHERYLQTFIEHRADVLVGTQMIAKGLDLPLVTLVGVISADTALNLPDYRSSERTFQLLTQVSGRAGRSHLGGQVVVQTYHPEHYAIQTAASHDYAGFYQQELARRRRLGYPPFSRLAALRYSHRDASRARSAAERVGRWLATEIQQRGLPAHLIGPTPCFFSRIDGRYRWQIVIRANDPRTLLADVTLPHGWRIDIDPVGLL